MGQGVNVGGDVSREVPTFEAVEGKVLRSIFAGSNRTRIEARPWWALRLLY
jgi:hypothetical protein